MYAEEWTGPTVMDRDIKILTMVLNIKINARCALMKLPSPFEETVTGDTFLVMMENTALRHIHVGTYFQLYGAPPVFPLCVCAFLNKEFTRRCIGKVGPILWPTGSPDLTSLDLLF
jgi:hypothetical protein